MPGKKLKQGATHNGTASNYVDAHGSDAGYRYGFQGQEMDDEVKGKGNSINYKYRMHDPRIGRFFAVDPLAPKYPHYTPYSFSGNQLIHAIELEGLEEYHIYDRGGVIVMTLININADFVVKDFSNGSLEIHNNEYVYKEFQEQMKDAHVENGVLFVPNYSGTKKEFSNPNSEPGNPLTPDFAISTANDSKVEKKGIDGHTRYDAKSGDDLYGTFGLAKPIIMSDGSGNVMVSIIPEDYDYIDIYVKGDFTKEEILEGLKNAGADINKDIHWVSEPPNILVNEDAESIIDIQFGEYE